MHTLSVVFTPEDTAIYTTAQAAVSLTVSKAKPVITWTTPAPIAYGAELSATQLNATASVPGTFVYTPAAGVVPTAGVQTLLVTFTPTDSEDYATEQATVSLTITKATPAVAWPAPDPIAYGVALSAAQLNATALVPGKFTYLPGDGVILAAGRHSLTLTFAPTDSTNYTAAHATVSLAVTKATPAITWATPVSIAYGAALSASQLNATASVQGQFIYTPAAGEVLTAGVQALSVAFTPTDAANYTTAEATSSLTVTKATPIVTWSKPHAISYGTALSATQLNATASVPGTFVYIPAAGVVLTAGVQPLSATFTPADAANYSEAQGAVWLTISKATPIIIWPAPAPILSGDALSAAQLNATALVPGTFVYTPAAGVLLPAGTHTLSVTFTPTAITNYTVVRATVPLTVTEAAPAIPPPAPAQAETPLPLPTPAPEMPLAETPVKPPAEPAKPLIEPAKPLVEPVQQAPAEAPAAPPAKAAAEPPAESPAKPPVETPAKALVKVPPPRFAIEAGSGLDLMGTAVFPDGTTIYLVMQPGSGGPQDSKRLVSQFLAGGDLKPEIVINRYEPRPLGAGEDQESQALTKPASSPITRLIGQMAQPVSEPPAPPEKKKGFSLKGLRRSLWAKVSPTDQEQELTQLGLAPEQEDADSTQPAAPADKSVDAPHAEALPMSGTQAPSAPKPATDPADVKRAATPASAPYKQVEPETRTYQGATYVKGTDGKWHLQQLPTSFVKKETLAAVSPVPSPIAATAVPITTERSPSFQPEPVKAVPAQAMTPAPEAEPAPAHTPPEAPAKAAKPPETPVAMAPVKPPVEATAKASVKAAIKPPVKAPAKATVKAAPVQAMKPAFEAEPEPEKTPAEAPAETTPAQAMKPAFEAEPEPDKTPAEAPAETAPAQVIEPAFEAEPEPDKTPAEAPAEAVPAQVIEPAFEAEPEPEKTPAEAPAEVAAKPPVKAIKKPAKKAIAKPPVKAANKPAKNASAKAVAKPARKPAKKVMAKPPVKTAKKPAKKASSKAPANPAKKSVKKVMAKPPVKATHKPARKSLAKSSVKAARKPVKKVLVKASAKAPAKTSKKASAKVQARHSAPAKKKLTPTARAKQAKAAKPKIRKPAPKPAKKR
jgi:hypothetical protein